MNVKALLHDSPPDAHRRRPDTQPWGTHPLRDPRDAPQDPVPQPDANRRPIQPVPSPSSQSPAMASLRPLDAPLQAQPPVQLTQQPVPSRRMPSPPPQSGIWGSDRSGSDREQPRDLRDRPRDRLPPLLDQPRKKNIAMEVNGPLSGPGVPISGPGSSSSPFFFFSFLTYIFQMTWLLAVVPAGQASAAIPSRRKTSSEDASLSSVPKSALCANRAENATYATAMPGKATCISATATENRVNGTLI